MYGFFHQTAPVDPGGRGHVTNEILMLGPGKGGRVHAANETFMFGSGKGEGRGGHAANETFIVGPGKIVLEEPGDVV